LSGGALTMRTMITQYHGESGEGAHTRHRYRDGRVVVLDRRGTVCGAAAAGYATNRRRMVIL
jgi:hypothetical protein